MGFFEYLDRHWILVTFMWIPAMLVVYGFSVGCLKILWMASRGILKSLNIWFRGWPPSYLDANGDYIRFEPALKEVPDVGES